MWIWRTIFCKILWNYSQNVTIYIYLQCRFGHLHINSKFINYAKNGSNLNLTDYINKISATAIFLRIFQFEDLYVILKTDNSQTWNPIRNAKKKIDLYQNPEVLFRYTGWAIGKGPWLLGETLSGVWMKLFVILEITTTPLLKDESFSYPYWKSDPEDKSIEIKGSLLGKKRIWGATTSN